MRKILILAAHPDDEVLGCGGLISKYSELGDTFRVVFLGEGSSCRFQDHQSEESKKEIKIRNSYAVKAMNFLGVSQYDFHGLPCGRFDQVPIIEINKIIENQIKNFKPDLLLTHSANDANNDHQIVYRASIMASRPLKDNTVPTLWSYEVLSSSEWSFSDSFTPNIFESLKEKDIMKKFEALSFYESELRPYPFPRSFEGIKALSQMRGLQSGLQYAEAFKLIRSITK